MKTRIAGQWISVKDGNPEIGEIVLAWMAGAQEPVCVRYQEDRFGPLWVELRQVAIELDVEDLISHWMPISKPC